MRASLIVICIALSVVFMVIARRQIHLIMPANTTPVGEARVLAMEGRYEEALAKHLWIHNHILEERPSYYGVRLSFALSAWVDLGKQYPKALTALIQIRDDKTKRLANGERDRELFHDVVAINDHLEQNASTVALFKTLEGSSSEFAAEIYKLAEDQLVGAREYKLAMKHMGDSMKRLETARNQLQEGLSGAEPGKRGDDERRAHQHIFSDEVVNLITILKNVGQVEVARRLQSEALKSVDSPEIRNALTR